MSDFTKGEGGKIVIKFDRPLVGDVSGSKPAFTISGYEPRWIGDIPQPKTYTVDRVDRYPIQIYWQADVGNGLVIPSDVSITDSKCYETTSGTTLTGTVTVKEGDYVLATITHRSTLTLPSGWEKIYESDSFSPASAYTAKMVFAVMQATEDGTVSLTVTQSSAQRIYINLISVSGISGIEVTEYEVLNTSNVTSVSVPDKQEGEMLIWGCSANLWITSSPYGYWSTSPNDLIRVSLADTTQTRQANFIDLGGGAATGRTFTPNGGSTGTPCVVNAVRLKRIYNTSKTYNYGPIQIQGLPRIKWTADTPAGTSVKVEYATGATQGEWQEVDNGDEITNDINIWIQITLSTTDTTKTPMLSDLWLEDANPPQDIILLTMTQTGRFNNAVGDITVAYDSTKGTLAGIGGAVASFTRSFTPEGLEPQGNPAPAEHISATLNNYSIVMTKINFISTTNQEYIGATIDNYKINLIDIEDINP